MSALDRNARFGKKPGITRFERQAGAGDIKAASKPLEAKGKIGLRTALAAVFA